MNLKNQIEKKELELKALLEITQAINSNLDEGSLYKIFKFTVISNLKIARLGLFVLDGEWNVKIHYGTQNSFDNLSIHRILSEVKAVTKRSADWGSDFDEFDLLIPVSHQGVNLALLFVGGFGLGDETNGHEEIVEFLQAISNILVVAVQNKRLMRRELEQEAFRKELEIAGDVQQLLFPERLPSSGDIQLEASYLPHDLVGGDYYDFIPLAKDRFIICIADVSGKGVGAALMMSNFQASLRTLVTQTTDVHEIVVALNKLLTQSTKSEKFITAFIGHYDYQSGELVYINAGHNPPVLKTKNEIKLLDEGCTVLGAIEPLPVIKTGKLTALKEFLLFCYTDGLTETIDESGHEFGLARLLEYLEKSSPQSLKVMHQDVIILLDGYKGSNAYRDDITMLSCRVGNPNF